MLTVPYKSTFVKTNGVHLHVITAGPENGKPVMLLHGFPEFWYGWRCQIPALAAAGFRVIVPDQRGYNLSDAPKDVTLYKQTVLFQDILGLLDHFGIEKVNLVGHDWGAVFGWNFTLTFPARIERYCSLGVPHPTIGLQFLARSPRQMLKSWYAAAFQIPRIADWVIQQNDFEVGARILYGWGSNKNIFSNEDIVEYKKAWANSGGFTGMINWYRAFAQHGLPEPKDIHAHMPVLIQSGKQDPVLSYEMMEGSLALCDNGQLIGYDNVTHWVQLEEAEAVNKALIDFLKS
jgi:pimeloyl-ACP methyl ester carboxylesterase